MRKMLSGVVGFVLAAFLFTPAAHAQLGSPFNPIYVVPSTTAGAALSSGQGTFVQGNNASGQTDSGNPEKIGGYASGTAPGAVTAGQRVNAWYSLNGVAMVALTDQAGTAFGGFRTPGQGLSNTVSAYNVLAYGTQYNGTTWDRASKPNSTAHLDSSAATTNATSKKASAADVFNVNAYNTTASVKYLKLYNKASAPTVGTDTPLVTYAIPANGSIAISRDVPLYFSTGLAFAITGAAADTDATAVAAGDVVAVNIEYQ